MGTMWVEIPLPIMNWDWRDVAGREDFEKVIGRYKVRQVVNSRMVISRDREVKPVHTNRNQHYIAY
jgi:hypothetical protein